MSSPLRRGTHESWWTAERAFFNAVAKVPHILVTLIKATTDARPYRHSEYWMKKATWSVEPSSPM
jgi:2-oxoisovalerate dehydrogenase E1 component alpha subunit